MEIHYGSVASSPAVGADGTIYVESNDNNLYAIYLYAISPDGNQKWKFTTGDFLPYSYFLLSSPAVGADGTIYVGSQDANLYAVH
ncbi:MAG: PQQ-binding-like beta-propeller repeat protein [Candidatus Binataceae bacterium]